LSSEAVEIVALGDEAGQELLRLGAGVAEELVVFGRCHGGRL
jgi:hypothetical protein